MNYKELTELAKAKKVFIKDLCLAVGMSRQGLQFALDNETIELKRLKLLCDNLRISPASFFESGSFGLAQNNTVARNKEIDQLKNEVELLRSQLRDKNEIIALYREKSNATYGIVAENKDELKLTKK